MGVLNLLQVSVKKIAENAGYSLFRVPAAIGWSLLHLRDKNARYVLVCSHIGDFLLTLGYLQAHKQAKQTPRLVLCMDARFEGLLNLFPDCCDDVLLLPAKRLEQVVCVGRTNFGQAFLNKMKNICPVNPADAFTSDYFQYPVRFPQLRLEDCIKYGALELPEQAPFQAPRIPHKPGDSCKKLLLCPDASVTEPLPRDFYEQLARHFAPLGFTVYTNAPGKDDWVVPGTLRLSLPLEELAAWVDSDTHVVGVRSGLLDLLAYTSASVIAVYPQGDIYQNFYDLTKLPGITAKVYQCTFDDNIHQTIQSIIIV